MWESFTNSNKAGNSIWNALMDFPDIVLLTLPNSSSSNSLGCEYRPMAAIYNFTCRFLGVSDGALPLPLLIVQRA